MFQILLAWELLTMTPEFLVSTYNKNKIKIIEKGYQLLKVIVPIISESKDFLIVFGGYDGSQVLDTVEVIDLSGQGRVCKVPSLPNPVVEMGHINYHGTLLYCGGQELNQDVDFLTYVLSNKNKEGFNVYLALQEKGMFQV